MNFVDEYAVLVVTDHIGYERGGGGEIAEISCHNYY